MSCLASPGQQLIGPISHFGQFFQAIFHMKDLHVPTRLVTVHAARWLVHRGRSEDHVGHDTVEAFRATVAHSRQTRPDRSSTITRASIAPVCGDYGLGKVAAVRQANEE